MRDIVTPAEPAIHLDHVSKVFGKAETPRSQDARTIGGMSCATTRMLS